jgi:hypothetical protein
MKRLKILLIAVLFLLAGSQAVLANYTIDIRPNGSLIAETGDELSFDIYLVADDTPHDLMLYAFGLWLDPSELSYRGWDYANPANFTDHVPLKDGDPSTPELDPLTTYDLANVYGSFNANDPNFALYTLSADEELWLGTLTADVLNPFSDGEWDVAIQYDLVTQGDSFFFNDIGPSVLAQTGGPDIAAVPIPGAVILLGSGLLGLIGIRRRQR